jgi:hypothetical protein
VAQQQQLLGLHNPELVHVLGKGKARHLAEVAAEGGRGKPTASGLTGWRTRCGSRSTFP